MPSFCSVATSSFPPHPLGFLLPSPRPCSHSVHSVFWKAQPTSPSSFAGSYSSPSKTLALSASPLGAQDLPAQFNFEFELRLGRRRLHGSSLFFLVVFFLVFLLVLLVLFLVHSVAVGTCQTQLQRFPCGRRVCQQFMGGEG